MGHSMHSEPVADAWTGGDIHLEIKDGRYVCFDVYSGSDVKRILKVDAAEVVKLTNQLLEYIETYGLDADEGIPHGR